MFNNQIPPTNTAQRSVAKTAVMERGFPRSDSSESLNPVTRAARLLRPVTLDNLDRAQLHDRVESKVILRSADVPHLLSRLVVDYAILEHDGQRVQGYRTEYFDSPRLRDYHEHHNQKRRRMKLRYRTYLNSDLTFFELKRNIDGRTVKERRSSRPPLTALWVDDARYFQQQTGRDASQLTRSLTVDYQRLLLVKHDLSERVTIDLAVSFSSAFGATRIPGLAICEFKQPVLNRRSPALVATRRRPQKFSKYCMGLASCDPSLKRNRFKKVFRSLEGLGASPVSAGIAA